jgi:hypothetical protein
MGEEEYEAEEVERYVAFEPLLAERLVDNSLLLFVRLLFNGAHEYVRSTL